eukprot:TRINITY_DN60658_c0_g1_i1.p1 TRINITY_DN60658_c0_g1~~TRINITY_DN60658_c0_g1_i1.p1  ORF type:complete len:529 (+),score=113.63 TRINITY_DN60658_c0_g1_i1:29-1615(+)
MLRSWPESMASAQYTSWNLKPTASIAPSEEECQSGLPMEPPRFRSTKVRSIAREINELESRWTFLDGRNRWLTARLLAIKSSWAKKHLWTSDLTRKTQFFAQWKAVLQELRMESALEKQTAALNHCQEVTKDLSKVLAQEQAARRAVEAEGQTSLDELKNLKASTEGLQAGVDANAAQLQVLARQLREAEASIQGGRQYALSVVHQMELYEQRRLQETKSTKKAPMVTYQVPEDDPMQMSRKVRSAAKDTLEQVSSMLAQRDPSPQRSSPQRSSPHRSPIQEYRPSFAFTDPSAIDSVIERRSPVPSPVQVNRSPGSVSRDPQQQHVERLLEQQQQRLEQQQQQLEQQRQQQLQDKLRLQQQHHQQQLEQQMMQQQQLEQQMNQQREQEQLAQQLQEQQRLQHMQEERTGGRLQHQHAAGAGSRASSSGAPFQGGHHEPSQYPSSPLHTVAPDPIVIGRGAVHVTPRPDTSPNFRGNTLERSLSPHGRQGRKLLMTTGPAIMRGGAAHQTGPQVSRPPQATEPWWYGQ